MSCLCDPRDTSMDSLDRLLLRLDFGDRIRVTRQVLDDLIEDLGDDDPPSPGEDDVLPVVEAARDALKRLEASL